MADDGRVCIAQRADEEGLDSVQITKVLLLLVDELVYDARRKSRLDVFHRSQLAHTSGD